MSLICPISKRLLAGRSVFCTQKRFNVRESIHRYREPDKFKKHMLAAVQPYFKREIISPEESCKGVPNEVFELLPIEKIYIKELIEELRTTNYALLIQYNDTLFQNDRVYKNILTKLGAKFLTYNNRIYKEVFKTLGHEDANFMFVARNALVTGQIESLSKCVKALKKMPTFILLGGYVDNYLYDVKMLTSISQTSDVDHGRAILARTLETPSIELAAILDSYESLNKPTSD